MATKLSELFNLQKDVVFTCFFLLENKRLFCEMFAL